MKLNTNELTTIQGGMNITGTLINSFTSGINTVLNLGRSVGSAVRRITEGNICKI